MRILCGFLMVMVFACGDDDGGMAGDAAVQVDALDVPADARPFVCDASTEGGTHKLFINFDGVTVTAGPNDATANTAGWLGPNTTTATIPAYNPMGADRAAEIERIVCRVRESVFAADLAVVTTRPTEATYEMAIVGGPPQALGHGNGVGAITATDCGNTNMRDIAWIGESNGFSTATPEAIANQIASTFGVNNALEPSQEPTNCMCHIGTGTGCDTQAQCHFTADAMIRTTERICGGAAVLEDQIGKLVARYGARP